MHRIILLTIHNTYSDLHEREAYVATESVPSLELYSRHDIARVRNNRSVSLIGELYCCVHFIRIETTCGTK